MKDILFKRRVLILIIAGVVVLLIGSLIVGSFVIHHPQNPTGATETSGCSTPLAPREKMLYVLGGNRLEPHGMLTAFEGPLYISAVDTNNGQQSWMQPFTNFSPAYSTKASLNVKNGIIYAFATASAGESVLSRAAAYDAKSGKQLWSIQIPNTSHSQSPVSDAIVDISICNNRMYLWTRDALYAYNAKNGSLLWQYQGLSLQPEFNPHVEVTDTAIVFASGPTATSTQGTSSYENSINALNPKNGVPLWKVNIPSSPSQGPSFAAQGLSFAATDRAVYIDVLNPGSPQKIDALSISTGKQLWNTSVGKPMTDAFPSAVVGNNIFYVSTNNYGVMALNTNDGRHLWQDNTITELKPLQDKLYINHRKMGDVFTKSDFCQFDPVTGKSQWCNSYAGDPLPGAISDQTTVYIPSADGVNALQKNNGKLKWIYKGKISGTALTMTNGLSLDY